jgi:hypothetical protein
VAASAGVGGYPVGLSLECIDDTGPRSDFPKNQGLLLVLFRSIEWKRWHGAPARRFLPEGNSCLSHEGL